MKKMMIAVAMTIALPAAAFAHATPAPATAAPSAYAGHNMQEMHCKDMHASMSSGHAGHQMSGSGAQVDQSKMEHSKMAAACKPEGSADPKPQPEQHQNHQQ